MSRNLPIAVGIPGTEEVDDTHRVPLECLAQLRCERVGHVELDQLELSSRAYRYYPTVPEPMLELREGDDPATICVDLIKRLLGHRLHVRVPKLAVADKVLHVAQKLPLGETIVSFRIPRAHPIGRIQASLQKQPSNLGTKRLRAPALLGIRGRLSYAAASAAGVLKCSLRARSRLFEVLEGHAHHRVSALGDLAHLSAKPRAHFLHRDAPGLVRVDLVIDLVHDELGPLKAERRLECRHEFHYRDRRALARGTQDRRQAKGLLLEHLLQVEPGLLGIAAGEAETRRVDTQRTAGAGADRMVRFDAERHKETFH